MVLLKKLIVDMPKWSDSDKYSQIKAIVQIRFSCADDYICDIAGSCVELETVEIGHWDRFTIEEACELIGCSRFKLGELFMEEAESHVYQAL